MAKNPLHGRHRNLDGRISQTHHNARAGALRGYGTDFATGYRSHARLRTVLDGAGAVKLFAIPSKNQQLVSRAFRYFA